MNLSQFRLALAWILAGCGGAASTPIGAPIEVDVPAAQAPSVPVPSARSPIVATEPDAMVRAPDASAPPAEASPADAPPPPAQEAAPPPAMWSCAYQTVSPGQTGVPGTTGACGCVPHWTDAGPPQPASSCKPALSGGLCENLAACPSTPTDTPWCMTTTTIGGGTSCSCSYGTELGPDTSRSCP